MPLPNPLPNPLPKPPKLENGSFLSLKKSSSKPPKFERKKSLKKIINY